MRKYQRIRQSKQEEIIITPQKNQYVYLQLINGCYVEGSILYWSDYKSAIQLENKNILIIHQTLQNVILIQIKNNKEQSIDNTEKIKPQEPIQINSMQEFSNLKLKKMSELKAIQAQQEKENFAEQARSFKIKESSETNYEKPGFFKQYKR